MYSSSAIAAIGGLQFLYFVLVIVVLIADVMLIAWLVRIARDKGTDMSNGALWFIGLFTTPVALGIAVMALPDRGRGAGLSRDGGGSASAAGTQQSRGPELWLKREPALDRPVVTLGSYKQNGGFDEPIEWYVLERHENREALLLSKKGLASRPYHGKRESVTWASCDLRAWLNGEFLQEAFSVGERKRIVETHLENEDNTMYRTSGGDDTDDRVFLLSLQEVEEHFGVAPGSESGELVTYPTERAISQGANGACVWWLRSPGDDIGRAACVGPDGYVYANGNYIDRVDYAVRPACWVKLES